MEVGNQMIDVTDKAAVIRQVQAFLFELGRKWEWLPAVYPDGIWDEPTRLAVSAFQGRFDLPVTGEVDRATWELLYAKFAEAQSERTRLPVPSVPGGTFPLSVGCSGYAVGLLRGALGELAEYYPTVGTPAPTSLYQFATERAVKNLQSVYRLPPDGKVSPYLWNLLFYDLAAKQAAAEEIPKRRKKGANPA